MENAIVRKVQWRYTVLPSRRRPANAGCIFHLSRLFNSRGADNAFEFHSVKTFYPTFQPLYRSVHGALFRIGGSRQQIHFLKLVFAVIKGIKPVEKGLHLTGHSVVIYGRGKYDDVAGRKLVIQRVHAVFLYARAVAAAIKTAQAEFKLDIAYVYFGHDISAFLRSFGKLLRQQLGIAVFARLWPTK